MASPRQHETLEGIDAPLGKEFLSPRRSFLTVTRPQYWNLNISDYQDLSDRMIERAASDNFRSDLMGASRNPEKFVIDYELDSGDRQTVTLNAGEYRAIHHSFNPYHLAATVNSATRSGKFAQLSLNGLADKSDQNQLEALEAKQAKMRTRVSGLIPEQTTLARLVEATGEGISYKARGGTDTLRMEVATLLEVIIPNMLTVVGHSRKWTDEQLDLAKRSLEHRLFFTLNDLKRMGEWNKLTTLLHEYDSRKIYAFQERIGRFEATIGKLATAKVT